MRFNHTSRSKTLYLYENNELITHKKQVYLNRKLVTDSCIKLDPNLTLFILIKSLSVSENNFIKKHICITIFYRSNIF